MSLASARLSHASPESSHRSVHVEQRCSPATVTRIETLIESALSATRDEHPDLSIPPGLAGSLRRAWIAALERHIEPCPSPGEVSGIGMPPRTDCGCLDPPPADTLTTWLQVFNDLDEDGQFDVGEPGLAGVQVSNGTVDDLLRSGSELTAADGSYIFDTPLHDSRFVFVTVPSGFRPTTPYWRRIDVAPDTVRFGLAAAPATADSAFRWVQITDMQVSGLPEAGEEHCEDLLELESLAVRPAFIIVTGDLVTTGNQMTQFETYWSASDSNCTTIPIHHGYGDHDACTCFEPEPPCVPVCGPQVINFETHIGPSIYSFEHGGIHFVMFNDFHSVNYDPVIPEPELKQYLWLLADIQTARARQPDIPVVICKHMMLFEEDLELYADFDLVVAVFSGHFHGSRLREFQVEGGGAPFQLFDVTTAPSRYAGIDKSSRGFRVVDMYGRAMQTEFRQAGIDDHLRITHPAAGDSIIRTPHPVRLWASVYRTVAIEQEVEFSLGGPGDPTMPRPMNREGAWAWSALWDASQESLGTYELTVSVEPDVGLPFAQTIEFRLVAGDYVAAPNLYSDWPSYKCDAAGSGRRLDHLIPPLRFLWARNLGSPTNLTSPAAVATRGGGRVYIGTSKTATHADAHLVCVDAATGDVIWEVPTSSDIKSTPAVGGGSVFFTTSTGAVLAVDALDGTRLWQTQLGDSLTRWEMTSPTFYADMVYVGGPPAMAALDAATGEVRWLHVGSVNGDFIPSTHTAPAVVEDVVVFTNKSGIFAFDRLSGTLLWEESHAYNASQLHRSAAIAGSIVYTAGAGFNVQRLRAYQLRTGALLFEGTGSLYESTSAPIVGPGPLGQGHRIIVANGGKHDPPAPPVNGRMQSFLPDSSTAPDWSIEVGSLLACSAPYKRTVTSINSTPAWAGSYVYFGADDGILYCADVEGLVLWSFDLGVPIRSSPAVAGNMLFVNAADGTLYAFLSTYLETASSGARQLRLEPTRLDGNWPNPFNPDTWIGFHLEEATAKLQPVTLKIYDPSGRMVRALLDGRLPGGSHRLRWDGRDDQRRLLASKVYFYELRTGRTALRGKLVLAR